jgi:hypothetical protein
MKLIYKGVYKNPEQLDKGELPENAVMFKEPDDPLQLNVIASLFAIPGILLIVPFYMLHQVLYFSGDAILLRFSFIGILLAFLSMPLHEYLHAICFGKKAEVHMYIIPTQLMAFVYSTVPISKARFIFLSLLPSLVLGWIPLTIWTLMPPHTWDATVFTFAALGIIFGCGDYMNIYNAARQMPRGSLQQLSGFHSYWYCSPDKTE